MIETLQEENNFMIGVLIFLWRGMNISLVETLSRDGSRFLTASLDVAGTVEPIVNGNRASWTISREAMVRRDVAAHTISGGLVGGATP